MNALAFRAAVIAAGLFAASTVSAEPVYMVAQIGIEDQEQFFGQYGAGTGPILAQNEAQILVATPSVNTLEGEWNGNWTVVLEFPSETHALAWWESEDYQNDLVPVRQASTSFGNLILAPAFAGFEEMSE